MNTDMRSVPDLKKSKVEAGGFCPREQSEIKHKCGTVTPISVKYNKYHKSRSKYEIKHDLYKI